jgi:hypothetical protein
MVKMSFNSPQLVGLFLCACFALMPGTLLAQNEAPAPSRSPGTKPGPTSTPKYTDEQVQEMVSKVRDRIKNAADQVLGRFQKEEGDLYLRFSYFNKPNRLDPNTYATKEEIAVWQQSLQQLKEKEASLEKLYSEADQDLGNALIQQRINTALAEQIKNELLKTFPWETIRKKSQLIQEFVAENGSLLAFYDQNWGTWKPGAAPFSDPKLAATYQSLKEKITATGTQIEGEYKTMLQ